MEGLATLLRSIKEGDKNEDDDSEENNDGELDSNSELDSEDEYRDKGPQETKEKANSSRASRAS